MRPRREPNQIVRQIMPLLLLGTGLVASNNHFTILNEEAQTFDAAVHPMGTALAQFLSGAGQHLSPPLYNAVLHMWIRLTGGSFVYLRFPAIFFFLAGLFLLSSAAGRIGGPSSAMAVAWLGALWPFGFHHGRLATWYCFAFFLIAGLTLAYLRYLESPGRGRWMVFILFAIALLWTTYFGWVLLACLAVDALSRCRAGKCPIPLKILAGSAVLLIASFIPLFRAFFRQFGSIIHSHQHLAVAGASAVFNAYTLFVSESVAPWYWRLSVPVELAIAVFVVLSLARIRQSARLFLLYSAFLIILMALAGTLSTAGLFLVAPWLLLPAGVAVATITARWERAGLALALLTIAVIGWYGMYARAYYSTANFLEPWSDLAGETANKARGGVVVVSNSPSFFFYLTYILRVPDQGANWKFRGSLPDSVRVSSVMSADQWMTMGHPITPTVDWIRATADPRSEAAMDAVAHEIDQKCGNRTSRLMSRDPGYQWKQKVMPRPDESPWRIEVREYDCSSTPSQEVFQIPGH